MSKPKEYYVHFTEFEQGKHIFEYKRSCTNAAMRVYKHSFGIKTLIEKSAYDKAIKTLKLFTDDYTCTNKRAATNKALKDLGEI